MLPGSSVPLILAAVLLVSCVATTPEAEPTATSPGTLLRPTIHPTSAFTPTPVPSVTSTPRPLSSLPASCLQADPEATPLPSVTPEPNARLAPPPDVATPAAPRLPASHPDAALQQLIEQALGPDAGDYAVVVKELETGRSASVNADQVFYAASIFKLFVMYEVFQQEAQGLLSLDDELVMTPYYDSFGLGPRATELCQRLTVAQALDAMMSVSDNAAAVLLQDLVGSQNINDALAALGLSDSRLLTDDLPLTAADVALLLEAIGRGQAVSRDASQAMIDLMVEEVFDNGLVAGLPDDVEVAHKTGNWDNATHDAGLVYAPSGVYVIVVLSDRDHDTALTQRISSLVYDYLASH